MNCQGEAAKIMPGNEIYLQSPGASRSVCSGSEEHSVVLVRGRMSQKCEVPLNLSRMSHNCPFIGKLTFSWGIFLTHLFGVLLLAFPEFPPTSGTIHQYHHSNKKSLMVSCLLTVSVYTALSWVTSHCHQLQGER